MFKVLVALILSLTTTYLFNDKWISTLIFLTLSVMFQLIYARKLNIILGGSDPMKYRARNLKELGLFIPLPFSIILLNFLAKSLAIAFGLKLLIIIGFLGIRSY
jgi:hypothetical protein